MTKAKLIILILAIHSFGCVGQIQTMERKVEVGTFCRSNPIYPYNELSKPEYIGLFAENGKFYLRPTLVYLEEGYDDCNEVSCLYLATRDDNCLFLFSYL